MSFCLDRLLSKSGAPEATPLNAGKTSHFLMKTVVAVQLSNSDPTRAPHLRRRYATTDIIGWLGLYIFALGAGLGAFVAYLGLSLVLVSFLGLLPRIRHELAQDTLVIAFLFFSAFIVWRAVAAELSMPRLATQQQASLWSWLGLWFFIPIGWQLRGRQKPIFRLLLLGLIGLLGGIAIHIPWGNLPALLSGMRSGLGMPFLATAMYTAVALLGWAGLARRVWGQKEARWHRTRIAGWIFVTIVLLQILVIVQSRAVWLSLLVIFPIFIGIAFYPALRHQESKRRRFFGRPIVLLLVVLIVGICAANWHTFAKRFGEEHRTIKDIVTLNLDDVPKSSIGLRVYLARLGWQKLEQRPWMGWGPGVEATQDLSTARLPFLARMAHLHDTYLETLVRLGTVGFLVAAACIILFIQRLSRAYRAGRIPRDYFLFLCASGWLVALWSLIDFQALHTDYRFFTALMLGLAYSCMLPNNRRADNTIRAIRNNTA